MLARSGATLPLAAGTGPVAALAGPRGCAETGLSRGGAASTVAARVSAGLVADEAGVQRLSDHSPKTSPSWWIAEAVLAFPLPCSSRQGLASSRALGEAGLLCCRQDQAALEESKTCPSPTLILLWEQS